MTFSVNQLRGLLQPSDVLVLVSVHGGKGFSGDLVAVRYANEVGAVDLVSRIRRRPAAPGIDVLDPRAGGLDAKPRRFTS